MNIYYAGIGSRKTPKEIIKIFIKLGFLFAKKGFTLRSGGAPGADMAFENGCFFGNGKMEIYLPWKNFNNNYSKLYKITEDAMILAESFHPAWDKLTEYAKNLHSRNCYQILGFNLNKPVNFVVCWTPGKGGTEQALRIARAYKIPIFNFYNENTKEELIKHVQKIIR